mmetsp:Transcript_27805/g.73444  ORF Transcript_27805/g.73444 Transcript_27805/m.73444 type:complete len:222 (+) Transcript_27805:1299-1964(+)
MRLEGATPSLTPEQEVWYGSREERLGTPPGADLPCVGAPIEPGAAPSLPAKEGGSRERVETPVGLPRKSASAADVRPGGVRWPAPVPACGLRGRVGFGCLGRVPPEPKPLVVRSLPGKTGLGSVPGATATTWRAGNRPGRGGAVSNSSSARRASRLFSTLVSTFVRPPGGTPSPRPRNDPVVPPLVGGNRSEVPAPPREALCPLSALATSRLSLIDEETLG